MKNEGKEACISSLSTKAADEVESKYRNKQVMKKKDELQNSGCSLYMFASLHEYKACGYVLYKIDYKHLSNTNYNQQQQLKDVISTPLLPFLVSYPGDLPDQFCSSVHMGDYLYFVGQKQSDVFKIAKSDIKDLFPTEHNFSGWSPP